MSSQTFNENDYFHYDQLLSYNRLISIILSNRGDGKTFGAKDLVIKRFLQTKQQFVYIRRYDNEFKIIKTFFSDIAYKYPDHTFAVKTGSFYIDGELAGFYLPLSIAYKYKSTSFNNVFYIIFDEFIIDHGARTYLKDEVTAFLDLIETIGRTRDVRVIMLSNSISQVNPYFAYWNIHLKLNQQFWKNDSIVVQSYINESFINKKKNTAFGRLVADTKYGRYSIDNEWLRDNNNFIASMSGQCKPILRIIYFGQSYNVFRDENNIYFFTSKQRVPDSTITYTLTTDDHNIDYTFVKSYTASNMLKALYDMYTRGFLRFNSLIDKQAFIEMMQL